MTTNTKLTNTVAIDQERCQACGETAVRWIGSVASADTWTCTGCGHQWTIPVDEPSSEG